MYEGVSASGAMSAAGKNPYRMPDGPRLPVQPEGEIMSLGSILSPRLEFQRELLERLHKILNPVLSDSPQEANSTKPESFPVSCHMSDQLAGLIGRVDATIRGLDQICGNLRV